MFGKLSIKIMKQNKTKVLIEKRPTPSLPSP